MYVQVVILIISTPGAASYFYIHHILSNPNKPTILDLFFVFNAYKQLSYFTLAYHRIDGHFLIGH